MSFIGIICDEKLEGYVKQTLKHNLKTENIIAFSNANIENLKNIKFEIILIMSKQDKILLRNEILKNIISKAKYLVINADAEINLDIPKSMNLNVITYGFNNKSTITTSSVEEENIMLCVQRSLEDCHNNVIELQEINIEKINDKIPTNAVMGVATILLLKGIREIKL